MNALGEENSRKQVTRRMTQELTALQRRFIEEYVRGGFANARQAALAAGYSESVADNAHREILGSTTVAEEISELKEALASELKGRLLHEAEAAVKALGEVLRTGKDSARVSAAREILDRCGVIRVDRHEQTIGPHTVRVVYDGNEEHPVVARLRESLASRRADAADNAPTAAVPPESPDRGSSID